MSKLIFYMANRIWVIVGIYTASLLMASYLFSLFESKVFHDGV